MRKLGWGNMLFLVGYWVITPSCHIMGSASSLWFSGARHAAGDLATHRSAEVRRTCFGNQPSSRGDHDLQAISDDGDTSVMHHGKFWFLQAVFLVGWDYTTLETYMEVYEKFLKLCYPHPCYFHINVHLCSSYFRIFHEIKHQLWKYDEICSCSSYFHIYVHPKLWMVSYYVHEIFSIISHP